MHSIGHRQLGQDARSLLRVKVFNRNASSVAAVSKRHIADVSNPSRPDSDGFVASRMRVLLKSMTQDSDVQELWELFEKLSKRSSLIQFSNEELLLLCRRISECDESLSLANDHVAKSALWGSRLQDVLQELRRRPFIHNLREEQQLNLYSVIACALTGSSKLAAEQVIQLIQVGSISRPNFAKRHVLLSFLRHFPPANALDFFVDQALILDQHNQFFCRHFGYITSPFWDILVAAVKKTVNPVGVIRRQSLRNDKQRFALMGTIVMDALCQNGMALSAYAVLRVLKFYGASLPYIHLHDLVRALAKQKLFDHARHLHTLLAPSKKSGIEEIRSFEGAALCIAAHQGRDAEAQTIFARLLMRGQVRDEDTSLLMQASAMKGDTRHVLELFDTFFTRRWTSLRPRFPNIPLMKPSLHHYTIVAFAFASTRNSLLMTEWLKRLEKSGLILDVSVYNTMLKNHALDGDVSGLTEVLSQMSHSGIRPDVVSYTIIITCLARKKDVVAVEAMYRRMLREGVTPDSKLLYTVLNAHVEAGSWQGVIRTFDYVVRLTDARFNFDIDLYNILLKAYVKIGAPIEMVLNVYRRLKALRIQPTSYTFTCLIRSALQARRMDLAARIFVTMDRTNRQGCSTSFLSPHIYTMIMESFLRHHHWESADAVFDDMVERGFKPTSYTFRTILASYAGSDLDNDQLLGIENFIKTLIGAGDRTARVRPWLRQFGGLNQFALGALYAPVIKAYSKRLRIEDAERLYNELSAFEEQPSIGTKTLMLDVYRRSNNVEGVRSVWSEIFDLALSYTNEIDKLFEVEYKEKTSELQRNPYFLCVPLSICIDALSRSGQHLEIARIWEAVRAAGFQFDAYNWNHLAVALLRAGEPRRAFQIVERVIIPYQRQAMHVLRLPSQPADSPLLSDRMQVLAEMASEPPVQPLPGSFLRRARAARNFYEIYEQGEEGDSERIGDFAHGLELLQQLTPSWGSWRPQSYTLRALADVIGELRSGNIVPGLTDDTHDEQELTVSKESSTVSPSSAELDPVSHQRTTLVKSRHSQQAETAQDTISWLHHQFPMTMRAINFYLRRGQQKMNKIKARRRMNHRRRYRNLREEALKKPSQTPSIWSSPKIQLQERRTRSFGKVHVRMQELVRPSMRSPRWRRIKERKHDREMVIGATRDAPKNDISRRKLGIKNEGQI